MQHFLHSKWAPLHRPKKGIMFLHLPQVFHFCRCWYKLSLNRTPCAQVIYFYSWTLLSEAHFTFPAYVHRIQPKFISLDVWAECIITLVQHILSSPLYYLPNYYFIIICTSWEDCKHSLSDPNIVRSNSLLIKAAMLLLWTEFISLWFPNRELLGER